MQYSQLAIAAYRLTHAKYEEPWLMTGQPRISIMVAAPCAEALIESCTSIHFAAYYSSVVIVMLGEDKSLNVV